MASFGRSSWGALGAYLAWPWTNLWPEKRCREVTALATRTFIGLDVHQGSIYACALDRETGERRDGRFRSADRPELLAWLLGLPQPCEAACEVGTAASCSPGFSWTVGAMCRSGAWSWQGRAAAQDGRARRARSCPLALQRPSRRGLHPLGEAASSPQHVAPSCRPCSAKRGHAAKNPRVYSRQ